MEVPLYISIPASDHSSSHQIYRLRFPFSIKLLLTLRQQLFDYNLNV